MIKFNKEQLVMQSVQGKVHPPVMKRQYRVGSDGPAMDSAGDRRDHV